ncbi:MAG: hypothetical protein JJV99_01370 [Colwellia sp.]|nr:hypothetical protein [Colwellia sp.]
MNPLFLLPLHGICCVPFCTQKTVNHRYELTVDFNAIEFNKSQKPIWSLIDEGDRYHSEVLLFKNKEQNTNQSIPSENYLLQINCQGKGLFKISDNEMTIDWQSVGTDSAHYFQTLAVALYLELKQVLCIHANALAFENSAIALVAPSRTGKTTLTAALSQQGFSLMTDDMMALHKTKHGYHIYPSWPVARMWPDSLAALKIDNKEKTDKVHNNFSKRIVSLDKENNFNFCDKAKPLKVIYLLNRLPEKITEEAAICEIKPIKTAQAIIILLQNSILGSCYRALNLEKSRIKALSELLDKISFKQINYISGKEYLTDVGELIKHDIKEAL